MWGANACGGAVGKIATAAGAGVSETWIAKAGTSAVAVAGGEVMREVSLVA